MGKKPVWMDDYICILIFVILFGLIKTSAFKNLHNIFFNLTPNFLYTAKFTKHLASWFDLSNFNLKITVILNVCLVLILAMVKVIPHKLWQEIIKDT